MNPVMELFRQTAEIWFSGGWAMVALTINALILFGLGIHIHYNLKDTGFRSVSEDEWREWIVDPAQRAGPVGELLDFVTGGTSLEQTAIFLRS